MTISSFPSSQNLATDTWLKASWEEFLALAMNAAHTQGRFYYDEGYLRVEMAPVGPVHGRDNSITAKVISLYAALNNISIQEFTNTSFRRTGLQECQPDSAFYIGSEIKLPSQSNAPVELGGVDGIDAPSLVVEIAASSLDDDLGRKRLLYEQLGVQEYWVVDTEAREIIAFSIAEGRSGRIAESRLLSGLAITTAEAALRRSLTEDDGAIMRWLLQTFSSASG